MHAYTAIRGGCHARTIIIPRKNAKSVPTDTNHKRRGNPQRCAAAASSLLAHINFNGGHRETFFNCARAGTFSQALETAPCQTPERTPHSSTWLARPLAIGRALAGQRAAKASFMPVPVFKLNCTCLLVVTSSSTCQGRIFIRCVPRSPTSVLPSVGAAWQWQSGQFRFMQYPMPAGAAHATGTDSVGAVAA